MESMPLFEVLYEHLVKVIQAPVRHSWLQPLPPGSAPEEYDAEAQGAPPRASTYFQPQNSMSPLLPPDISEYVATEFTHQPCSEYERWMVETTKMLRIWGALSLICPCCTASPKFDGDKREDPVDRGDEYDLYAHIAAISVPSYF